MWFGAALGPFSFTVLREKTSTFESLGQALILNETTLVDFCILLFIFANLTWQLDHHRDCSHLLGRDVVPITRLSDSSFDWLVTCAEVGYHFQHEQMRQHLASKAVRWVDSTNIICFSFLLVDDKETENTFSFKLLQIWPFQYKYQCGFSPMFSAIYLSTWPSVKITTALWKPDCGFLTVTLL